MMVESNKAREAESPKEPERRDAEADRDAAGSPGPGDPLKAAISDLDRILSNLTGRLDLAPSDPAEAAERGAESEAVGTETGDGPEADRKARRPSNQESDPPSGRDAADGPAAGDRSPEEPPDGGDAPVEDSPARARPETPAEPVDAPVESPARGAEPDEYERSGRRSLVQGQPWPEHWGLPSQQNVDKVLDNLLAEIKEREPARRTRAERGQARADRPERRPSSGPGADADRPVVMQPAPPPAGQAPAERQNPEKTPGGPCDDDRRPDRAGTAPVGAGGRPRPRPGRRPRGALATVRAWFSGTGRDALAERGGHAGRPARRTRHGLRDPATDPVDVSRRKPASPKRKRGRGFVEAEPVETPEPPAAPIGARPLSRAPGPPTAVARLPADAHEYSPWILNQPEFLRAFGLDEPEPEPAANPRRPASAEWVARWRPHPLVAASIGLVLALLAAYAVFGLPSDHAPTDDDVAVEPAAPAGRPGLPAPSPPQATASPLSPIKPPVDASGWTIAREVPVESPSPSGETSFQAPVAAEGEAATIQVHPTSRNGQEPQGASTERDAVLDVEARNALKLLLEFKVAEAEAVVATILARNPRHLGGLIARGRVELLRNDFIGAESAFGQALRANPLSGIARLGLAEALLGQRRGAEALSILNAIVASAPDVAAAYDLRARAFAQSGDAEAMLSDCRVLAGRANAEFVGKWCEGLGYKDAGAKASAVAALTAAIETGSAEFVRHRQHYLKFRGHYQGDLDGEVGPATRQAITACVDDPGC